MSAMTSWACLWRIVIFIAVLDIIGAKTGWPRRRPATSSAFIVRAAETPEFYSPTADDYINTGYYSSYSYTGAESERGSSPETSKSAQGEHKILAIPGDIIFGGLFPIHHAHTEKGCGKIDPERGVHRLEAMLFTLDKINYNFSNLLPGIRLGALVMDSCGSDYIALERSLEIVQTVASTNSPRGPRDYSMCLKSQQTSAEQKKSDKLIGLGLMPGLIGAASSSVSIQVASLFRLFRIPMISYASTSAELSDKKRYGYFARTVPSDIFQAKAVIDILLNFDWTYVSVIYSDGDYGTNLYETFLQLSSLSGICIAHVGKLSKNGELAVSREHVKKMIEKKKAKVVVLFIEAKDVRQFLKAVTLEISSTSWPFFQFVASDGWGTQKALLSDANASLASEGAITLEIKTARLPGFDEYFKRKMIHPDKNKRNPWFKEFCDANEAARRLMPSVTQSSMSLRSRCWTDEYTQDSKTIFVHNAVYAFALALRDIHKKHCGENHIGLCDRMIQNLQAENIYRTILNVTFKDPIGRNVKFDEFGDAAGHYNIYKYRRQEHSENPRTTTTFSNLYQSVPRFGYGYERVGEWSGHLLIDPEMRSLVPVINETTVKSKCSLPCSVGQAMRIMVKGCCWECANCGPNEYVDSNTTRCISCEPGWWPDNETRSYCYILRELHLEFFSWYVIPSAGIAFAGMLMTTIAIVVYVKFVTTPLVKASSVELSFIILSGCFVTFLTTFFYLLWPSLPICIIRRLSFGLGIASIYSAIAVKINRIYRIFEAATKSSQQPPMISPESQLILVACFVGVQLVLSVVSLLFDPPDVVKFNPSGDLRSWYTVCTTTARSYALLMAVTIFLIIGATYYAIRTRNCPEPYREARVVGFSVYTTCIIWLAFVPLFFTTSANVELQTTVICISLSLCGWVVLVCLFAHRIYIIVFVPSKNVKPGKFTLSSSVNKSAAMKMMVSQHRETTCPSTSQYLIHQSRFSEATISGPSRNNANAGEEEVPSNNTVKVSGMETSPVQPAAANSTKLEAVVAEDDNSSKTNAESFQDFPVDNSPGDNLKTSKPSSIPEITIVSNLNALEDQAARKVDNGQIIPDLSVKTGVPKYQPACYTDSIASSHVIEDLPSSMSNSSYTVIRHECLHDDWGRDRSALSRRPPSLGESPGEERKLLFNASSNAASAHQRRAYTKSDKNSNYSSMIRSHLNPIGRLSNGSANKFSSRNSSAVAPLASISSLNTYNLPGNSDFGQTPSVFSSDSQSCNNDAIDKTVKSAFLKDLPVVTSRHDYLAKSDVISSQGDIADIDSTNVDTCSAMETGGIPSDSLTSSRDDIASILERHDQLTAMGINQYTSDRVIAISDDVIDI